MDDKENPAVTALTRMPPALLEELGTNEAALQKHARILLAVNIDVHHRQMRQANAPIESRQKFMSFLAEVGNVGSKAAAKAAAANTGPAFSVNFILPTGTTTKELTSKPVVAEVIENAPAKI